MTRLPDLVGSALISRVRRAPVRLIAAATVLIAVAVAAAWTPAVRLELRRSFTRLPAEYAELWFTGAPAIRPYGARSAAFVAVTLLDHGATARDHEIRFTLTGSGGAVLSSFTAELHTRPEVPAAVTQPLRIGDRRATGPYLVEVALTGRAQTLHYRIDSKGNS
jgi:hypothetical protein